MNGSYSDFYTEKDKYKAARRTVNYVALICLVSITMQIAFYTLMLLFQPYIGLFIRFVLTELAGEGEMYAIAFAEGFLASEEYSWFLSVISTILCSYLPFALLSKVLPKNHCTEFLSLKKGSIRYIPFIYAASMVLSGIVSRATGAVFSFLFPEAKRIISAETVEIYGGSQSLYSLILCFIAMCVVAPLVEEFIYRGIIFGALKPFGFAFASVASSLMFGIAHGTAEQIAYAFVFGLVLCYVTKMTGSIKCSVVIHLINNLVGYLQAYILPLAGGNAAAIFDIAYNILVGIFAVIGMLVMFLSQNRKEADADTDTACGICESEQSTPLRYMISVCFVILILYSAYNLYLGML